MTGKTSWRMRRAVDRSIKAAQARGVIDLDMQAGPICALRILAEQMDDPDWPLVGGKLDNVSLPTLLRYCQALGIVMDLDGRRKTTSTALKPKPVADEFEEYLEKINNS